MKPQRLWWLSFADYNQPFEKQFLGVAIVPGSDMKSAIIASHILQVNPGGEVCAQPLDQSLSLEGDWLGRLLDRDEVDELNEHLLELSRTPRHCTACNRDVSPLEWNPPADCCKSCATLPTVKVSYLN